ncbi:MAG TPA: hypothetical protein VHD37_01955 [Candidatus Paceibacterota bacterium]|nr:hypothetical protein [Candidatus Paceibacterota bacterium]
MIPDMLKQGKRLLDFLLIPAIVILVGVACFGLGRLSALKEARSGIVIHDAPEANH